MSQAARAARVALGRKNTKAFESRGFRQPAVERHELQRVGPILRGHLGGGQLKGLGRGQRMNTHQPLGAATHSVELGDERQVPVAAERVDSHAGNEVVQAGRQAVKAAAILAIFKSPRKDRLA